MIKTNKNLLAFILLINLLVSCGQSENKQTVNLYVAAGLSEAMDSITSLYSQNNQVEFKLNKASSGMLARQIEQGAPVDIYFSANIKWMEHLAEKKIVADSSYKVFAGNKIVFIKNKADTSSSFVDIIKKLSSSGKKLAMGEPEHVPAGKYAKESLEKLNLWNELKPALVFTKDVRAALILTEMGEAEYAMVYRTDAMSSSKVSIVETMADSLHQKILFSAAQISNNNEKAKAFYDYIYIPEAISVFEHFGFILN